MLTFDFWAAFLAASLLVGTAAAAADSLRRLRVKRRSRAEAPESAAEARLRDAA